MYKNSFFFLILLLFSCGEIENKNFEKVPDPSIHNLDFEEVVWVCHNPGHPLHGEKCVEEVDISRGEHQPCFWSRNGVHNDQGTRNPNAFCWLLEKQDCIVDMKMEWQKENCHFFNF